MSFESFLSTHETAFRLSVFFTLILILSFFEWRIPFRKASVSKSQRWVNNFSLVLMNSVALRILFPAAAVGAAIYAEHQEIGLFNWLDIPFAIQTVFCVVLLDLIIYLQHLVMHKVSILWRLHKVHHADLDVDLSTGLRFHTLEIILSMMIKFIMVILLGANVTSVIIFEILLNGMAMFNHSNIALPERFDRLLRKWIVTPNMHRSHHHIDKKNADHNYGFNLSIWDHIFKTHIKDSLAIQKAMLLGISECRVNTETVRLDRLLIMPFLKIKESKDA